MTASVLTLLIVGGMMGIALWTSFAKLRSIRSRTDDRYSGNISVEGFLAELAADKSLPLASKHLSAEEIEAERIARLLVSEIKLYREEEVETVRRTGRIPTALKEDIERSRVTYLERIDPKVETDFFLQRLSEVFGVDRMESPALPWKPAG